MILIFLFCGVIFFIKWFCFRHFVTNIKKKYQQLNKPYYSNSQFRSASGKVFQPIILALSSHFLYLLGNISYCDL